MAFQMTFTSGPHDTPAAVCMLSLDSQDYGAYMEALGGPLDSTCLHVAASHGHPSIVSTLIARGAQSDARDKNGNTALMKAWEKMDVESAKVLLPYCTDEQVQERDDQGQTVFHRVCRLAGDNPGIVAEIVKIRPFADFQAFDMHGNTALTLACVGLKTRVIRTLPQHGAVTDEAAYHAIRAAAHRLSSSRQYAEQKAVNDIMKELYEAAPKPLQKQMKKRWLRREGESLYKDPR